MHGRKKAGPRDRGKPGRQAVASRGRHSPRGAPRAAAPRLPFFLMLRLSLDDAGPAALRRTRWDAPVAVACATTVLALWFVRFVPDPRQLAAARVCAAAMLPLALVFAVLLLRAATDRTLDPHSRRAWRWLSAAGIAWWASGALWELLGRPALSVADLVQLAFFPCVLRGVFAFPAPRVPRPARVRFWLDASVVVLSGAAAIWYFVVWPSLHESDAAPLAVLVNAMYPVADLALLFAACVAMVRRAETGERRVLACLSAGLVARFAGDLSFGWETVTHSYAPGGVTDLTWTSAACFLAMASSLRGGRATSAAQAPGARVEEGTVGLLPYISVVALFAFLLASMDGTWGSRAGGVLIAAVTVTALVLIRQYVASRQLVRLQRERGAAEAARTGEARFRQLVQHSTDVIAVLDADGTIRYVSPSVLATLGRTPDALLGTSLSALIHPEEVEGALSALVTAGTSDEVVRSAHRAPRTRGRRLAHARVPRHQPTGRSRHRRHRRERARRHRARAPAGAAAAPGLPRPAHGTRQPRALPRSGRARAGTRGAQPRGRHGAVPRPRRLQDRQRLDGPRGRRPAALAGGGAAAERDARVRHGRAAGRRRVRGAARADALGRRLAHRRGARRPGAEPSRADGRRGAPGRRERRPGAGPRGRRSPTSCCGTPTWRCTARSRPARAAWRSSRPRCTPRSSTGWSWRPTCGARSRMPPRSSSRSTTSPSSGSADGVIVGAEALVRWTHPARGRLSPGVFMPIAEASGLIVPLGAWVLREACRVGARWVRQRQESSGAPFTLTVNLSGRQLLVPGFVDEVAAALHDSGLDPRSLILEITETRHHAGDRGEPRHAARAQGAGAAAGDRRLRHGLLVASATCSASRSTSSRSTRASSTGSDAAAATRRSRARSSRSATPSRSAASRRAWRTTGSARTCRRSAASSPRASSSRARCRPGTSTRCWPNRSACAPLNTRRQAASVRVTSARDASMLAPRRSLALAALLLTAGGAAATAQTPRRSARPTTASRPRAAPGRARADRRPAGPPRPRPSRVRRAPGGRGARPGHGRRPVDRGAAPPRAGRGHGARRDARPLPDARPIGRGAAARLPAAGPAAGAPRAHAAHDGEPGRRHGRQRRGAALHGRRLRGGAQARARVVPRRRRPAVGARGARGRERAAARRR